MKKVLICAGGTGGHIFPAISLAEELRRDRPDIDFGFIGGRLDVNRFFPKDNYPFYSIDCSPLSLFKFWQLPFAGWQILTGLKQSLLILQSYQPDLIVGFGSYYTFPALVAARLAHVPYILHEANQIPGKVNRLMAPGAIATAIHFPEVALKGDTIQVSMPLRPECRIGSISREEAAAYYGLDPKKRTLLIMGGSQGAHALNKIAEKTEFPLLQTIHLTGHTSKPTTNGKVIKDFEINMHYALALADVAICRAGANTIAELIEFEIPAVLVPYPRAADNHQEANARFFESRVHGGVVLLEKEMTPKRLLNAIEQLQPCQQNIKDYKKNFSFISFGNYISQIMEKLSHE